MVPLTGFVPGRFCSRKFGFILAASAIVLAVGNLSSGEHSCKPDSGFDFSTADADIVMLGLASLTESPQILF